ncbi:MAG: hypothetical protein BGN96_12505 [Bacteroidales bacterium 45-6]|uniref:hypothetical protein n=1 Tax=uncultured Dysgonomonas sp. TaxID=206096 RepID=UPI000965B4C9|nr:hypothetical protein [uncultured Dysgonomonas sp.]OJU55150.1 MAG: hypothetical protein BGN96_12505 [Bacteroidales bacterium 45-6]
MSWNRIKFYSKYDGAGFNNLEKAEEILINFDQNKDYNINDIIELYEIKQYVDNDVYLPKWSPEEIENYKFVSKIMRTVIVRFWQKINDSNLLELFESLECWTVQDSFWELMENVSAYKQISNEVFGTLITTCNVNLRAILYREKIVKCFTKELRDFLLLHEETAELILSQYVEKHDREWQDLHFPKSLSLKDKEDIISRYLDTENPNLNYVSLVLNVKKLDHLNISDKTRLKAKNVDDRLSEELLNQGLIFENGVQVTFCAIQDVPFKHSVSDNVECLSYSTEMFFKIDHPFYYLSLFKNLFKYLDGQCGISLVSKQSELDILETIFMSSKFEYKTGMQFTRNDHLSMAQLYLFENELTKKKGLNIEYLIHYYITKHIETQFGLNGFRFNLPTAGTSYLEKIRMLLAEYDSFLRQYKLYCENGEIDFGLFEMSSESYAYKQIPSFIDKKYCYLRSEALNTVIRMFFSDQSGLYYVESFKDKRYSCLHDLILSENVPYDNFLDYQKIGINHLISGHFLEIDEDGFVRFCNTNQIFILKQIYLKGVLSYWHYDIECREILDELIADNSLDTESTLFNKLECEYLNYYLNDREFTNGLKLRNRFAHGTNSDSEGEIKNMYYILLRIIVLTILKVDNDLLLKLKTN